MREKHRDFFTKLAELLETHNVTLEAADDGKPYGMAQPLIEIEFNDPYKAFYTSYLDGTGCTFRTGEGKRIEE